LLLCVLHPRVLKESRNIALQEYNQQNKHVRSIAGLTQCNAQG
jgi:hypothetical protein